PRPAAARRPTASGAAPYAGPLSFAHRAEAHRVSRARAVSASTPAEPAGAQRPGAVRVQTRQWDQHPPDYAPRTYSFKCADALARNSFSPRCKWLFTVHRG